MKSKMRLASQSGHEVSRPIVGIVNDDPDMRGILARVVELAGLTAECHASARSFWRNLGATSISCAIVDAEVSGRRGLAIIEGARARGSFFPVFLVATSLDAPESTVAQRLHITVIDKPFDIHALARELGAAARMASRPPAP